MILALNTPFNSEVLDDGNYGVLFEKNVDDLHAKLLVHYYGPPRTVFGETQEQFTTSIVGTKKDGEIHGTISRPDRPQFDLEIRLTKRLDLPTARA